MSLPEGRIHGVRQVNRQIIPGWLQQAYAAQREGSELERTLEQRERARRVIDQELEKCLSALDLPESPDPSALIWIPMGEDPTTGRCIPPILNQGDRIASGTDLRHRTSNGNQTILQINNTFTSIVSPPRAPIPTNRPQLLLQQPVNRERVSDRSILVREEAEVEENPQPQNTHDILIPKFPKNMAAVIRHWIRPCPRDGLSKPLVKFTTIERNSKPTTKRLYSKRKILALAFLHYSDLHGIKSYEENFSDLFTAFSYTKLVSQSSSYLSDEYKKSPALKNLLRSHSSVTDFTSRVCTKLDLNKLI